MPKKEKFIFQAAVPGPLTEDQKVPAGEPHWHPNADEWQYFMSGKGVITVFATGGRARTIDFQAGDVGFIQKTLLPFHSEQRRSLI